MRFKIQQDSLGICSTCQNSQITKDTSGKQSIICHFGMHPRLVHSILSECSEHRLKNQMDEYQAEKIGWVLEVKKGQPVGFRPPKRTSDEA